MEMLQPVLAVAADAPLIRLQHVALCRFVVNHILTDDDCSFADSEQVIRGSG